MSSSFIAIQSPRETGRRRHCTPYIHDLSTPAVLQHWLTARLFVHRTTVEFNWRSFWSQYEAPDSGPLERRIRKEVAPRTECRKGFHVAPARTARQTHAFRRHYVMPGFHTTASVCRRHRCQLFVALLCYGDLGSLFSRLGGETTHDVCAHKDGQLHSSGFHYNAFHLGHTDLSCSGAIEE